MVGSSRTECKHNNQGDTSEISHLVGLGFLSTGRLMAKQHTWNRLGCFALTILVTTVYFVVFSLSLPMSCRGIIPHLHCHSSTCSIYHTLISLSFKLFSLVCVPWDMAAEKHVLLAKMCNGRDAKWNLVAGIKNLCDLQMLSVF